MRERRPSPSIPASPSGSAPIRPHRARPPQTDPFYRFQGKLGEERLLPGRDGPPGADYKTLPAFMDRRLQFCALRWPTGADSLRLDALRQLLADPADDEARAVLFEQCRAFIRQRLGDHAP